MCLAVPAEVLDVIDARRARVSLGGVSKEIALDLVDGVEPGDYVLVHVGFALGKIDPAEAARTLEALAASGLLAEELAAAGNAPPADAAAGVTP